MLSRQRLSISTPWYHGWNILILTLILQGTIQGLMTYSFTVWIVPFEEAFGASHGTILLAASLSNASIGAFAPVVGRLLDKHSIRMLTMIGFSCFCISFFLISLSTSIWQVIFIYATLLPLSSLLAGSLACQVMTARWFENNRGTALGFSSIGSSVGGVMFPPMVAILIVNYGWSLSFSIIGLVAFVIIIPLIVMFVRDRGQYDIEPGKLMEVVKENVSVDDFPAWDFIQVLKTKTFWILLSFVGPMMLVMSGIQFNIVPISLDMGIDSQRAAFLVSLGSLTMIFGKISFGYLSDRIQHNKIVIMASTLMILCLILMKLASTYWVIMIAIAILGLASGGLMPVLGVVVASRYGVGNFGRVNGILAPFTTAFAFGPVAIGYIKEGLNSYDPIYNLLMIILIPAVIGGFFLGKNARVELNGTT